MGEKQSLLQRLSRELELEGEPVPGQSLIEIAGDSRILVENHAGVMGYSRDCICVKLKTGTAEICGHSLELSRMTREQLVISGKIDAVTLHRRARK